MTFPERVSALTHQYLLPKVVDNVLNSNVTTFRLMGNAKPGAGTTIAKPIKYQNTNTTTSFSGLDTFAATLPNVNTRMSYDMRGHRIPLAISGMDKTANEVNITQVTSLVTNTLENGQQELIDGIGTALFGDGTGNGSKDFIGLSAIIDDGTNVSTIGSLSRTTYPVLDSTITSLPTLTLAGMSAIQTASSSGGGMQNSTLIVSDETRWDLYEQLLTPTVRENYSMMGYPQLGLKGGLTRSGDQGLSGTAGFVALSFRGIPYGKDEKATSGNIFFLNENWIQFYGWKASDYQSISLGSKTTEGLYGDEGMSNFSGFAWSGWNLAPNAYGFIADLIVLGNLLSWQPRRSARLYAVANV